MEKVFNRFLASIPVSTEEVPPAIFRERRM
jgi:hypothetical protein